MYPVVQPDALDMFHDQIRRRFYVSEGHQRRMMRTLRERTKHHAADFEGDDIDRALPRAQTRNLDDQRKRTVGPGEAVDRRHAAGVHHLAQHKAVDLASRARQIHTSLYAPRSSRRASRSGRPADRTFCAASS